MCYVSYKKNTANKNYSVRITKLNRLIPISNCAICGKKNDGSLKNDALLSKLGTRTLLSTFSLIGYILF